MFFVYILYSQKSGIFYVGHTDNLQRRLEEHNAISENSFTSRHRPWEIKAAFPTRPDRSLAMKVERHLKNKKAGNIWGNGTC